VADTYSVSTLGVFADISDEPSVAAAIAQVESTLPPMIGLANIAGRHVGWGTSPPSPSPGWPRAPDVPPLARQHRAGVHRSGSTRPDASG
jgi:hypothetical protein